MGVVCGGKSKDRNGMGKCGRKELMCKCVLPLNIDDALWAPTNTQKRLVRWGFEMARGISIYIVRCLNRFVL